MVHIEILSIEQLPPKICVICNIVISDAQDLCRHYQEHRLKYLSNIDDDDMSEETASNDSFQLDEFLIVSFVNGLSVEFLLEYPISVSQQQKPVAEHTTERGIEGERKKHGIAYSRCSVKF